jgi:uncharacterized protein YgiM (DUF1202 family)
MKRTALFAAALAGWLAAFADDTTRVAAIKGDRTNIRSKPAFDGEVLATLSKGDRVVVIGEVKGTGIDGVERPWSKIRMPPNVGVWVYGPLVDKAGAAIKGETANLRAGPGRNYSELGKLSKGAAVSVVRELDDWLQIEPPASAVAYVASSLLTNAPASAPEAPAETPPKVETPASLPPPTPPAPKREKPVQQPPAADPPAETASPKPNLNSATPVTGGPSEVPADIVVNPPQQPSAPDPTSTPAPTAPPAVPPAAHVIAPAAQAPVAPPATNAPPAPPREVLRDANGAVIPRKVLREGVVRRSLNIQSPGYYELRSQRGEGLLDYLISEDPAIDLSKFSKRLVFVTGEEWRDERWKTPVLKVSEIQPVN